MSTTIAPHTLEGIGGLVRAEPGRQITLMAYARDGAVRWDAVITDGPIGPVGQVAQGAGWDAATPAEALAAALAERQIERGDA